MHVSIRLKGGGAARLYACDMSGLQLDLSTLEDTNAARRLELNGKEVMALLGDHG